MYWKHHAKRRASANSRYKNDPEYRKSVLENMRAKRAADPDKARLINALSRAKPEHREAAVQISRKWREVAKLDMPWKQAVNGARKRAAARKIPFDLSDEWAKSRWTGRCELSGVPFAVARGLQTTFSPSIDRIEPKLGYTKDNCRFILWALNAMKGSGSDRDVFTICAAVHAERKGK